MDAAPTVAQPFILPFRIPVSKPGASDAGVWRSPNELHSQVRKVTAECVATSRRTFRVQIELTEYAAPAADHARVAPTRFICVFEYASALYGKSKALLDLTVQALRHRYHDMRSCEPRFEIAA